MREKGRVAAPVSARAEREVGEGWLGTGVVRQGREPRVRKEKGRSYPQGWGVWALEGGLGLSGVGRADSGVERGAMSPKLGEP